MRGPSLSSPLSPLLSSLPSLSSTNECIKDRGFGSFMNLQELPKHLQGASHEPLEASSGASSGSPDRFGWIFLLLFPSSFFLLPSPFSLRGWCLYLSWGWWLYLILNTWGWWFCLSWGWRFCLSWGWRFCLSWGWWFRFSWVGGFAHRGVGGFAYRGVGACAYRGGGGCT